jgi:hypothetical protein
MPDMNDEMFDRFKAIFKANQEKEEIANRAKYEEEVKNCTSFTQLVRSEYDPALGTIRHGVVYRKGNEERVLFKGETPEEGFTVVLVPYRGK